MPLYTSQAVRYHRGQFPPTALNYVRLMPGLLGATAALARYDQMLRGMHNSELFLAPLRGQEAVVSSRMEGKISTLDEILQLEAEFDKEKQRAAHEFSSATHESPSYRHTHNPTNTRKGQGA